MSTKHGADASDAHEVPNYGHMAALEDKAKDVNSCASNENDEKRIPSSPDDKPDTSASLAHDSQEDNLDDREDCLESFTPADLAAGLPFPEETLPYEEGEGLTIRALVVGTALGFIIAASNIYLGLKTGFTFGGSLFGSLVGFAIVKSLSKALASNFLCGGFFGPRENVTLQSAATGSSALTSMYVSAVPAMYRLNLLGASPKEDFGRLFALTFCCAFYGAFFAVPLRKFYILKQRLVFPSATATALAIRALHSTRGAVLARKKVKTLGIGFAVALLYSIVSQYVPGLLLDQHWAYWLYSWGWTSILVVDSWGWYSTLTPAFLGSGMLAGMNASFSFLGGLFLAYAVIGPSLVKAGQAKCTAYGDPYPSRAFSCTSTTSYKPGKTPLSAQSPRFWLIWPAVLMMLIYSFAELAMNGKTIYRALRSGVVELSCKVSGRASPPDKDTIQDPAPKKQLVSVYWVYPGVFAFALMTVLVCAVQFHMNAGNAVLAIILGFLFSFVGVQSSGTTDINPLSSVAKASQLIVGGAIKGQGTTGNSAMLENLLAGSIAANAASHSVDLIADLKTGHWCRASPRAQFWAQIFGSLFAVPFSVGLFALFTDAYPCIITEDKCQFGAPAVAAWKAVATAVVAKELPVSLSSGITAIVLSIIAAVTVVARYRLIPAQYHCYVPNWNAVGIGFLVPNTNYGIAMSTGATLVFIWTKKYPRNADIYAYALAAGLVAGEGIGGVVNAVLQIAGVSGSAHGSKVGLPPWLA